ncbi:SWPV1-117 [Shearwaterpox virus]|uniref:SWPV1-117 n=1 Tax=Shearwaterpox virus TaxID=1974596 RepID=A0A1V0S7W5_CNPV|nr:SWPV1-117 [Shearwaterpox virus]
MLAINKLIDIYEDNSYTHDDHRNTNLQRSFIELPVKDIIDLVKLGFYPQSLPRKLYYVISVNCVDKIYLLKPKYVHLHDLFVVINMFDNIEKYKEIILYYKYEILQSNNYNIINRCKDILKLKTEDNEDILLKDITDKELIDRMIRFPNFMRRVYSTYTLSVRILKEMYYKYRILPINKGITFIKEEDICFFVDSLDNTKVDKDVLYLILECNDKILDSEEVKDVVIRKICRGENIDVLGYYIKHYFVDHTKLGIYYNIFFAERDIVSEYGLRDDSLAVICKYIDKYSKSIRSIAKLLIDNSNYSLLASIIDKVPEDMLSENLYMQIVRNATDKKPKIRSLKPKFFSECLMVMCYLRGYEDIVDFLSGLDVESIIRNRVNPFNDYIFSTDWFNKNTELLKLYISFYFLDPVMMRKLLFEYPLSVSSTKVALDNIKSAYSYLDIKNYINLSNSFDIIELPREFSIPVKKVVNLKDFNNNISFISNKSYNFKIASQLLKYNVFKSLKVENLCYSRRKNIYYLSFNIYKETSISYLHSKLNNDTLRLVNQIGDIGRLFRHGFISFNDYHFGNWFPSLYSSKLLDYYQYNGPDYILSWSIDDIDFKSFIRYNDLPIFFAKKYNKNFLVEKKALLYSCIYSCILLYVIVGSVVYVERENIYYFITNIINSFLKGIGISNSFNFEFQDVVKEIIIIGDLPEAKRKLSLIKPVSILELCKYICVFVSNNGKETGDNQYNCTVFGKTSGT